MSASWYAKKARNSSGRWARTRKTLGTKPALSCTWRMRARTSSGRSASAGTGNREIRGVGRIPVAWRKMSRPVGQDAGLEQVLEVGAGHVVVREAGALEDEAVGVLLGGHRVGRAIVEDHARIREPGRGAAGHGLGVVERAAAQRVDGGEAVLERGPERVLARLDPGVEAGRVAVERVEQPGLVDLEAAVVEDGRGGGVGARVRRDEDPVHLRRGAVAEP